MSKILNNPFNTTPESYTKTIISDLQGSWECLKNVVIHEYEEDCNELIFHINEAMSWESVRDLNHMQKIFIIIRNLLQEKGNRGEVFDIIEDLSEQLKEIFAIINNGEKL